MDRIEQTISSVEVAEMVGKAHNKLMRDIREYIDQLAQSNLGHDEFFNESTYVDNNNRTRPCYQITKKGCEFIAHKLTGVKGTEFTAKYIDRFHTMEQIIADHIPQGKELLALAVLEAQKTINDLQSNNAALLEDNKRMKPKEAFADAVSTSDTSILIGELAKILRQNGVHTGQNRLFAYLRNNGYLIKGGSSKNMPTQKSMEAGLFEIKERTITNPDESIRITRTTMVTGKGQQYFINKLLAVI